MEFQSIRDAKEYLASRIVDEARRQGVPLNEVERKMLYFSETNWTLTDMPQVSAEFDRDNDQDEYEQKIAGLVRGIETQNSTSRQQQDDWNNAILKLADEDHYLQVLVSAKSQSQPANPWLPTSDWRGARPTGDAVRLILVALGVVAGAIALGLVRHLIFGSK